MKPSDRKRIEAKLERLYARRQAAQERVDLIDDQISTLDDQLFVSPKPGTLGYLLWETQRDAFFKQFENTESNFLKLFKK